jgi:hypothetical protein
MPRRGGLQIKQILFQDSELCLRQGTRSAQAGQGGASQVLQLEKLPGHGQSEHPFIHARHGAYTSCSGFRSGLFRIHGDGFQATREGGAIGGLTFRLRGAQTAIGLPAGKEVPWDDLPISQNLRRVVPPAEAAITGSPESAP